MVLQNKLFLKVTVSRDIWHDLIGLGRERRLYFTTSLSVVVCLENLKQPASSQLISFKNISEPEKNCKNISTYMSRLVSSKTVEIRLLYFPPLSTKLYTDFTIRWWRIFCGTRSRARHLHSTPPSLEAGRRGVPLSLSRRPATARGRSR